MHKVYRVFLLAFGLLVLAAICFADSLSDGRALYKAGKYAEAATKLEQATRENPNDAKAWWQLNFAYNKLDRYSDALSAAQKAGQIDPAHSFASEPGKYEETVNRLQGKASGGSSSSTRPSGSLRRSGSNRAGSGSDNITRQLVMGDVYVEPGINVDVERLRSAAQQLRPTVVKFVVLNKNIRGSRLSADADKIRTALNLNKAYVILASRGGVDVSSSLLDSRTRKRLAQQYAPQMAAGDFTGGLVALANSLVTTKRAQVQQTHNTWLGVVVVVAGVIILWIVIRSVANSRAMAARRAPLEQLKSDVINQLNMLDDHLSMVDPATASIVRQARVSAGTKLDEASRVIAHAKNDRDLQRAQTLLDQAQADIARGRAAIDRSMSGTPAGAPAAAQPGAAAAPAAATGATVSSGRTDWEQVAPAERGVCFFCSRPSLLSELTPVTVNLDGNQQKVLACADDLATIKTGQMPSIRAFNQGGRYVPWYAYQDYDPYRDYYSRGYDNRSLLSDMITYSMIDNMFWNWHHPMGWGWGGGYGWGGNTYVFYPDHDNYRDYYSGQAASSADFSRGDDTSADFLQPSGGDYEPGGSGADFGGDRS